MRDADTRMGRIQSLPFLDLALPSTMIQEEQWPVGVLLLDGEELKFDCLPQLFLVLAGDEKQGTPTTNFRLLCTTLFAVAVAAGGLKRRKDQ